MLYLLRLIDDQRSDLTRETFTALDDDDALEVAFGVYQAVSDHYEAYDVWQDERRVDDNTPPQSRSISSEELIAHRVANILDVADRLCSKNEAIKQSRKLLHTVGELRKWPERLARF